ncbi:MAG: DUF2807 domain-containing protein [Bacteroidaceae bacterium]|nr:DUF2807 domain-containing protein [Bacteroidaceae bacterium]
MKPKIFLIVSMLVQSIMAFSHTNTKVPSESETVLQKLTWMDLAMFDQLHLDVPAQVVVEQSDSFAVSIEAPAKLQEKLKIAVIDGCLTISRRSSSIKMKRPSIFVRIKAPMIKSYEVNGSGKVVVNNTVSIGNEAFRASVNGSGSVSVASVEASKFTAEVNGSGKVKFGAVAAREAARIVVNGSGRAHVGNLVSMSTRLKLHGSGKVNADRLATPHLKASINGSGRIAVGGVADKAYFEVSGSGFIDAPNLKTNKINNKKWNAAMMNKVVRF